MLAFPASVMCSLVGTVVSVFTTGFDLVLVEFMFDVSACFLY